MGMLFETEEQVFISYRNLLLQLNNRQHKLHVGFYA